MKGYLITLSSVAVLLTACGGRPRLVVVLGAPVEATEERSTGFDPELVHDNGDATFMGMRLASPTVRGTYESIEVHAAGRKIWEREGRLEASLWLIDGVVTELATILDPVTDVAQVETLGESVTSSFSRWQKRASTYWPYVARDFRKCAESGVDKVETAGTFVDESGVEASIVAYCMVSPSGVSYRIDVDMRTADAPR